MHDGGFSPHQSPPSGTPVGKAANGANPNATALRLLAGLAAPLAFGCAAMCFWFCVKPFGENPPPKEVALGVGCAFAVGGVLALGVAVFYRGSPAKVRSVVVKPALKLSESGRHWVPPPPGVPIPVDLGLPVSPRAKARRGGLRDGLAAVALLAILIGPVIGYIALQRQQVLNQGSPDPQTIRVADLGANGPGKNIHVKLTDFEFGDKYALTTRNGSWNAVCLAAFPVGRAGDGRALRVCVRTSKVHGEEDLREFRHRATVQGVVVNSIYEWERDREYMKEAYPGADVGSIWVVQEGYTFPNRSEIQTMFTISSGLVGLAVFCGVGALISKRG